MDNSKIKKFLNSRGSAVNSCTQQTWLQLPLVPTQVTGGGRKRIRPKLLPGSSKSHAYLGRHIRALEQRSQQHKIAHSEQLALEMKSAESRECLTEK